MTKQHVGLFVDLVRLTGITACYSNTCSGRKFLPRFGENSTLKRETRLDGRMVWEQDALG